MKTVEVAFASGRDVMTAFWGFLENGGLVIETTDFAEGDLCKLVVHVRSLKQHFTLLAKVARVDTTKPCTYLAFQSGPGNEELLNASYSDAEDVPLRKFYRASSGDEVQYGLSKGGSMSGRGEFVNVSSGGCCLSGSVVHATGSRLTLRAFGVEAEGQVRWVTGRGEMGIEFVRAGAPLYTEFTQAHARQALSHVQVDGSAQTALPDDTGEPMSNDSDAQARLHH